MATEESEMHTGSCHCGAVRYEVEGTIETLLECNCSHCSRKGFLLFFVPRDALRVTAGEDTLSTYTFNKHVIQHRFCPTCGVEPFAIGQMPDGTPMAAINARCLEGVETGDYERRQVNGREF